MTTIVKPYSFSAGATIIASEHNDNFDTVYSDHNGGITTVNILSSAAIPYSKLTLTGSVTNADVIASAGIPYSKLTITGSITNADIIASAGIPYSKVTLTGSVTNADVSASAAIPYSKLSLTGSVTNADISSAAGIVNSKLAVEARTSAIVFRVDGSGASPSTGVAGDIEIPFNCTITQTSLLADQNGSITIDVWKDTYANYPPTDADSITSQTPLTITTGTNKAQNTVLTGWITTLNSGDNLRFNIDSVGTITACTINIRVNRS